MRPFPVVGIGASAGGLQALRELLSALPQDPGMAFIIIQHLSPSHESILPELLRGECNMEVVRASDEMSLELNHVYVIPANHGLKVSDGKLRLVPRPSDVKSFLSIDMLFRSLARVYEDEAVGILLTGTGSDGTEGLKLIKAKGGITIVQTPRTARYPAMPSNAINMDHVDFVLDLPEIAAELVKLTHHPLFHVDPQIGTTVAEKKNYQHILRYLQQATGSDFSLYRQSTTSRRIARRMVIKRFENPGAYLKFLQNDPFERFALHDDILINVTSFFRNARVFEKLTSGVFPYLIKRASISEPIRIWVTGCATGEEAFSIAICMLETMERLARHVPLQIFATDLSPACIEKARAALFAEGIRKNVSSERLRKFFTRVETGYQLNKNVRDLCVFAKHNALQDPPFAKMDLISCRNLMIYLNPVLQKKLLATFHYSLKSKGVLLLGAAESASATGSLFRLIDKNAKVYVSRAKRNQASSEFLNYFKPRALTTTATSKGSTRPDEDFNRSIDKLILNSVVPCSVVVNENFDVVQFRGDTSPYLHHPSGGATFNLVRIAKEELNTELNLALMRAKKVRKQVTRSHVSNGKGKSKFICSFSILPLQKVSSNSHYYLVVFFNEGQQFLGRERSSPLKSVSKANESKKVRALTEEIISSRAYLESLNRELENANHDLQAANEEILSSYEELQSTNEEMESAKEELLSANEELSTVNGELRNRNVQLDRNSADLINLLGSIEIPIVMIGSDTCIRRFTPDAGKLFRLLPSDIGRPISDLNSHFAVLGLDINLGAEVKSVVSSGLANEIEVQDRESRWYRLLVKPYRNTSNQFDGVVITLIDIDWLKRSMEEVEKARTSAEAGNKAKDLFLATLSHELRTPLTTILSFAQMLKMGRLKEKASGRAVEMIEQSALSQAQLINDLLDVSRIIMGKLAITLQPVDPVQILINALDGVKPLAQGKSIAISTELPQDNCTMMADPVRLKQAFWNILTNAVKFSNTGGVIRVFAKVETKDSGTALVIRFEDNGKGISPEFLPNLFNRFSQADSSSTRVHGGLGLGLAIVRDLIERQKGTVVAESAGEQKGSTFTITLPVQTLSVKTEPAISKNISRLHDLPSDCLSGLKILVVEDDSCSRESLQSLLQEFAASVEVLPSPENALQRMAEFNPHVLISDIAMPKESGLDLIGKVRSLPPPLKDIPAVALSAYASLEDVNRGAQAGYDLYITKPFDSYDLINRLTQLIKSK